MLTSQFLSTARGVCANGLSHLLIVGDPFTERSAADYFLLRRCKLFQIEAGFTTQLPYGSLEDDVKVLSDNPGALL